MRKQSIWQQMRQSHRRSRKRLPQGVTSTIAPANLATVVTNNATTGVITVVTTIANNAINLNPGDSATLSYSAPTRTLSADALTSYGSSVLANPVGTTPNDTTNITYYGDTVYYWVRKTDQFTALSWENVNTVTNFSETLDISANRDPGYKRTFYWKDLDVGDRLSFKVKKERLISLMFHSLMSRQQGRQILTQIHS